MDSTLLAAYSFLAALTENNNDIYNAVFVPLCQRVLSRIAQSKTQGSADDVRFNLKAEYGLDVPVTIVKDLIVRVGAKQSRKDRSSFNLRVMEKGTYFAFDNFNCGEIEVVYAEERRCANALEEAYRAFAETEGYADSPDFQFFLDQNKHKLCSFFSGDVTSLEDKRIDQSYLPHAKFLRKIEGSNHQLYKAAERAYLGTLIAAYLEAGISLDAKLDNGIVYYIDTQVLLEALDLQAADSTHPALDVLDLIMKTGGRPKVLSITIDEIAGILDREIKTYNKNHPTTTIGDALVRLGHNKSWLVSLRNSIETTLSDRIHVTVDSISDNQIQEYGKSTDIDELVSSGYGKANAIHDVSAYLTVRDRRKVPTKLKPQKAKYWFVSANSKLSYFNQKHSRQTPEIVMPGELTSLLFLKDPVKYSSVVSKKGLSALIAQTLIEEYADKDLINDFDAIVRANVSNLSEDDYELLLEHVALESTTRLRNLIDDSCNKDDFSAKVHHIVEKTRNQKAKQSQMDQEIQEEKERLSKENDEKGQRNTELEQHLLQLEKQVTDSQKEISELKKKEFRNKKEINRWRMVALGVFIALVFVLLARFLNLKGCAQIVFNWIGASGGIWAFCNLVVNLWGRLSK